MKKNQMKIVAMLMAVTLAGSGSAQIPTTIMAADEASTVEKVEFTLYDDCEVDTATYSFDETTGALTITGDGVCAPNEKVVSHSKNLVTSISTDGVNEILNDSLYFFKNIKSAYINGNNLVIKGTLFHDHDKLEEIRFGSGGVFDTDTGVFGICENLKKLDIDASSSPDGTRIGKIIVKKWNQRQLSAIFLFMKRAIHYYHLISNSRWVQ